MNNYVVRLSDVGLQDAEHVGGKNASLGEMIRHLASAGVSVPNGFATTAQAYRDFLSQNDLLSRIDAELRPLNVDDVTALARTGERIREWILSAPFHVELEQAVVTAWDAMGGDSISVAVRSSATSEDLPDASFAGQQETVLNVCGRSDLVEAMHAVFASLFNDRAIAYRAHVGFPHSHAALSVGVQHMVRSDAGVSGVMFTLDTESGFEDVVFITAAFGLGESIVQGTVSPDEFYVYKPALREGKRAIVHRRLGSKATKLIYGVGGPAGRVQVADVSVGDRERFCLRDAVVLELSRLALAIEEHYGRPMDIEWGQDGFTGKVYILQARPETVQSRRGQVIQRYRLKQESQVLVSGSSIGSRIATGSVCNIRSPTEMARLKTGGVLVTDMTDPAWEPIMKRASAIVTNRGGRTCHAAIIARELGIPAVVGCGTATTKLPDGCAVTVSCSQGEIGYVYAGTLEFERRTIQLGAMPEVGVKIMMNIADPDRAFDLASIPHHGVGLARLEFIISRTIGVHPRALIEFETLDPVLKAAIQKRIGPDTRPTQFFIDRLSEGIATIACAFSPEPVIVRLSDFKSNEYANLLGGRSYEPYEENPMLGLRGVSRFLDPSFRGCFELECVALHRVREEMGLNNVQIMVPFVRTLSEAQAVSELLAANGLARGQDGLKHIMMCELPTNALLADRYLEYFDGMSIGSNDLTQLTLGIDRDSGVVAHLFDERDPAVKALLSLVIQTCRRAGKYIGICGQGPSDHADLAQWLVEAGVESISLNPDTVVETWLALAQR